MNILPEEISSARLESIKAGSKDRCYTNNDALNCVMDMLSARKDRNHKKVCFFSGPLLKVIATGINLLKILPTIHHTGVLYYRLCFSEGT